jgi:hypothetical protein
MLSSRCLSFGRIAFSFQKTFFAPQTLSTQQISRLTSSTSFLLPLSSRSPATLRFDAYYRSNYTGDEFAKDLQKQERYKERKYNSRDQDR